MEQSQKHYRFFNSKIQKYIDKAQQLSLPGFEKVPIYYVVKFFFDGLSKGYLATRASAIAFNFVLSIFPTLIFFFTLIPFIPVENLQSELLIIMKEFMPQNAYNFVESTMVHVVTTKNSGVLSFGIIAALIFSTNGLHALIMAFNSTYHSIETRKWLAIRTVSFLLVLILSVLITTAIVLITFSQTLLKKLVEMEILKTELTYYLLTFGKWFFIIALFFFAISFLYYYAPAKRKKFKFISAGSSLATILVLITSLGFSYFVNNFGQYNKLYGSIGTMMVILLWFYFNSFGLLIGFELNASINSAQLNTPKTENYE